MTPLPDRSSLGLAGDGDEIDLINDVMRLFGVDFTVDEQAEIFTVGDLEQLIEAKVSPSDSATCLARRVFRQLSDSHPGYARLCPSTQLSELSKNDMADIRALSKASGLNLIPETRIRPLLGLSEGIQGILFTAVVLLLLSPWLGIKGSILTAPLIYIGFFFLPLPRVPRLRIQTLGDLIRHTFHQIYPELARRYGPGRPCDRWLALVALCRASSDYDGPIGRNTTFFLHMNQEKPHG